MDGRSEQFLTGAAFASNQHGGVRDGDFAGHGNHLAHRRARAVNRLEGPKAGVFNAVSRTCEGPTRRLWTGETAFALAFGPILELILQDQDASLLLGDLIDLAAQLLIESFEGFLDVGRVKYQRGDRAERPQERHLLVFVGHTAALRAQDQQTGDLPFAPERGGCFPAERDHGVRRGVARAVNGHRVREPQGGCIAAGGPRVDCRRRVKFVRARGRARPLTEMPFRGHRPDKGRPTQA